VCFFSSFGGCLFLGMQLEQAILDFAEGLRICGISPDQNIALFADNSYRWLIADQGTNFFVLWHFLIMKKFAKSPAYGNWV